MLFSEISNYLNSKNITYKHTNKFSDNEVIVVGSYTIYFISDDPNDLTIGYRCLSGKSGIISNLESFKQIYNT